MVRRETVIGLVLFFDVFLVGGYLLVTEPLADVVWVLPPLTLFGLVAAVYLYGRVAADGT